MKFKISWNYKSSLGGPWLKGDVIELSDVLAEAVQRDSPGVLEPVKKNALLKHDRMQAEAEFERKTAESRIQEPIDTSVFKAVKNKED